MTNEQTSKSIKWQADTKALLILIATKLGATSKEIGDCLGIDDSAIRHIIRGTGKKKKEKRKVILWKKIL